MNRANSVNCYPKPCDVSFLGPPRSCKSCLQNLPPPSIFLPALKLGTRPLLSLCMKPQELKLQAPTHHEGWRREGQGESVNCSQGTWRSICFECASAPARLFLAMAEGDNAGQMSAESLRSSALSSSALRDTPGRKEKSELVFVAASRVFCVELFSFYF